MAVAAPPTTPPTTAAASATAASGFRVAVRRPIATPAVCWRVVMSGELLGLLLVSRHPVASSSPKSGARRGKFTPSPDYVRSTTVAATDVESAARVRQQWTGSDSP